MMNRLVAKFLVTCSTLTYLQSGSAEETTTKEAIYAITHAIIVEVAQVVYLIVIPLLIIAFLIFYNKAWHPFITRASRAVHVPLRRWILTVRLNRIYAKGDREKLRKNNRDNALNQARSNDSRAKMAGLAQLAEFPDEKTVLELIKIVASETDPSFRKMEIEALCKMHEHLEAA
jgi:hypothetical protein